MTSAPFFNQSSLFWQFVASLDPNNAENSNNNTNTASSSRQPRHVEVNTDFENNPLAFLFGGRQPHGRGGPGPHHPPPHSPWSRRGGGPGDAPPPPPPPPGPGPPPPHAHPTPPPPPATPAVPPFHDLPHRHRHDRHRGEESGPSGDESRHRHRHREGTSGDESDGPCRCHGNPGRGGSWGGRGRHGGPPQWLQGLQGLDMSQLGEFIQAQLAAAMPATHNSTTPATDGNVTAPVDSTHDFVPPVDVFDTETSYVVHVSLAGAKKEDLSVNWDAEKSELVVAGVVYRPGDEVLLKTLALDERKIGAFERRVQLGKKVEVEVEGISAKMEDGVLVVVLPKKEGEWEKLFVVDVD